MATIKAHHREVYFPYIHIILMSVTALLFALFLIKPLHQFKSDNTGPSIVAPSQELQNKLKAAGRTVETHLAIYDAPKFNFTTDSFSFKGYVIFTYDPKVISLDLIKQFDIQKGTLTKLDPIVINHKNGLQSAHFAIKVKFTMFVDYQDYPLDDHRVSFALINAYAKPDELLYVSSDKDFKIENEFAMARWRDVGRRVESGMVEKNFSFGQVTYPGVKFEIDYAHSAIRKTSIILLPLFLIFFLTTFGLSLNPQLHHTTIITITVTGISALMAYRYVIESISPNVGYFMLADYLFFVFFFTVFLNFMISMFIEVIPTHILKWIVIGIYLWIIAVCAYLLLFWL